MQAPGCFFILQQMKQDLCKVARCPFDGSDGYKWKVRMWRHYLTMENVRATCNFTTELRLLQLLIRKTDIHEHYKDVTIVLTGAGIGCPATGCWGLRIAGLILYCGARCIGTAGMPCAGIPMADCITATVTYNKLIFQGSIDFNAFCLVKEFTDYFNWFVFSHCIVVSVSYMC